MGFNVYVVQSKFSYCVCHYCSLKLIKICLLKLSDVLISSRVCRGSFRQSFVHFKFPLLSDCYLNISCTFISSQCQMVMLVSRTLLVFFGTLCLYLSRALLVFLAVRFLRWNIKHAWFFLVFYNYVGISRTLGFFWCSIRTITSAIYRVLVNSMSKLSSRYNKIDATFFSVVVDVIFTVDTSSSGSPGLKKK